MKKKVLSIIGTLAIIALMVFNTQFAKNNSTGRYSLSSLAKQAFAEAEGTGQDCYTFYPNQWWNLTECENGNDEGTEGGRAECFFGDKGSCEQGEFYYVYSCSGTIVGYGPSTVLCD